MDREQNFHFSIGLRHVLEDSLAVVRGQALAKDRRDLVLRNLRTFVNRAMEGSQSAGATAFSNSSGSAETIEAYELVHRMLSSSMKQNLVPSLRATAEVLAELGQDGVVSPDQRTAAGQLIELLLRSLKYESAVSSFKSSEASYLS